MIPPQIPGMTSLSAARHAGARRVLARSRLHHRGVRQEPSRRPPAALPTAHGFQEYWGYLYHLDAMQGVSFPDINSTPLVQGVAPPCKNEPIPGPRPRCPARWTGRRRSASRRHGRLSGASPQTARRRIRLCKDQGPLTLDRSRTVDEEISAKVIDFLDRNDPKKTNKPFFVWYNPARMHVITVLSDKYMAMVGVARRQGLGRQRSRHEADGRQHRVRTQEAGGHGPARQHHRGFHHG